MVLKAIEVAVDVLIDAPGANLNEITPQLEAFCDNYAQNVPD